ncbi:amino acid ABC transporter substrate-binding protein, PAAT family [Desulfitobacterium dichloroeliminans LMG P-21439]|uniref:Amino acid ABC transporter substrate-binding protein, PAAT family n=1 Tax=Desulfitobacterium dichloroeliminans (strain LMG P-21439 / DCA1) TaxID=871963 RepID=L0FDR5_DESDL|nr:basic amino acid ABC transporter substrate-binding protein [Desulfitobacterium dichloroeliminans]AGA70796.1 amino acid ABC transporter substrate-binding protein, PAAT family [Desulfitobacterium dichloroeliminans LMG P-21439]
MKKSLRNGVIAVLMMGVLALTGCGGSQAPAKDPAASGAGTEKVLKIGSAIEYAPFEFMDEKQNPVGFDIDLMNEIGKDMGYTVKFESSSFDGLVTAIGQGNYDAVISAMTITDDRSKSVLFSDPYFESSQIIAVKKGSDVKSEQDLIGKKVGVQQGTTGQEAVEGLSIDPKKFETIGDAINDMMIGGSDAVVADTPTLYYFIKQNPNMDIEIVSSNFPKEYFGIAFKLDNKELADQVNATLKKFMDNGKYNEIYKKWFNEDAPKF